MRLSVLIVSLVFLLGLGMASAAIPDHVAMTEYLGGMSCMGCHPAETTMQEQSTHYMWQSPVNGLGKANTQNTYCTNPAGSPGGAGIVRTPGPDGMMMTADDNYGPDGISPSADDDAGPDGVMGTNDDGLEVGGGCMMCHVGFGFKTIIPVNNLGTGNPWNDPGMTGLPEAINIDCLICHAPSASGYSRLSMHMGDEANPTAFPGLPGGPMYPFACFDRTLYAMNPTDPSATWCVPAGGGPAQACTIDPGTGMPTEEMCFYDATPMFSMDDRIVMMDDKLQIAVPANVGFVDNYFTLAGVAGQPMDVKGCGPRLVSTDFAANPQVAPQPSATMGGQPWPTNNQVAIDAARMVEGKPDNDACLRCHAGSGGSSNAKRGDIGASNIGGVDVNHDVHMASASSGGAGLLCVDCHIVPRDVGGNIISMEIPGMGMDMAADVGRVTCESCHIDEHAAINPTLESHADFIACQTCHIPTAGKLDTTEIDREWMNSAVAAYGSVQILANPLGNLFMEPGLDYPTTHPSANGIWHEHQVRSAPGGFVPEYVWWNGEDIDFANEFDVLSLSTGTLETNAPVGTMADKIYPVKVSETQWFTQEGLVVGMAGPVPIMMPGSDTHYAVPVTVGAIFQGWGVEAALRFGAYRNGQIHPAVGMPYMMFDPVTAMMGGDMMAAKAMIDSQMTYPFAVGVQKAERLGSLNHEVVPAADALDCTDCHSSSGPLDFIALGYSEPDQSFLTTLYDQSDMGDNGMTATSDVPALPAIGLAILGGSLAALAIRRMRK